MLAYQAVDFKDSGFLSSALPLATHKRKVAPVGDIVAVILAELEKDPDEQVRLRIALPLLRAVNNTGELPPQATKIFPGVQEMTLYVGQRAAIITSALMSLSSGPARVTDVDCGQALANISTLSERINQLDCWLESASEAIPCWAALLATSGKDDLLKLIESELDRLISAKEDKENEAADRARETATEKDKQTWSRRRRTTHRALLNCRSRSRSSCDPWSASTRALTRLPLRTSCHW